MAAYKIFFLQVIEAFKLIRNCLKSINHFLVLLVLNFAWQTMQKGNDSFMIDSNYIRLRERI